MGVRQCGAGLKTQYMRRKHDPMIKAIVGVMAHGDANGHNNSPGGADLVLSDCSQLNSGNL